MAPNREGPEAQFAGTGLDGYHEATPGFPHSEPVAGFQV